ncbi:hypothetical protein [Mycobacterium sp. E787]|uniref:hypothetical protein n=1 Tax=Mycobacterium sp. E787 TaxID=1834150 RepID=UPI001E34DEAE|nr:hypothetical protein [Mycobacterium sp. E787]
MSRHIADGEDAPRSDTSRERGDCLQPLTASRGSSKRPRIVRFVSAVFGVCVVCATIVTDIQLRPGNTAWLIKDFAQLQRRVKATIGIALAPVGDSATPLSLGGWHNGPAWSTMKVPLVIAALREAQASRISDQMTAAITESDNTAAEAIWSGLGDPVTAAAKVDSVLAETGDPTRVQYRKIRPEFSAFGQTDWPLVEQVRFLSVAACDRRNTPVLMLMGQIERGQRWGLGTIAGTRFKGGWGPSPARAYLVRQLGLISTLAGTSAVAVAAQPDSGTFADGIRALDQIAEWVSEHLVMLPSARCPHGRGPQPGENEPVGPPSG